jgi:hypothetical protein
MKEVNIREGKTKIIMPLAQQAVVLLKVDW